MRAPQASSSRPALDAFQRRLELLEAGRRRHDGRRVLRRVRPQPRVLHRLRVRDRRARARARRARSPAAAATTACWPTSARRRRCPAVGSCIHTERLLAVLERRRSHERQARPCAALQGPADGAVRRRAGQGRARRRASRARRAATRARSPGCRTSRSTSSPPPRSRSSSRAARAHLGITGEDLMRETIADCRRARRVPDAAAASAAPTWWWRCRPAGSTCGACRTWRRWRSASAARTAGRVRVATKYMNLTRRFFAQQGRHRLSHRREPRRHGGRARRRPRRADRRHHHDRARRCGQRPEGARRRRHPQVAGQPGRLQGRRLEPGSRPPRPVHRRQAAGLRCNPRDGRYPPRNRVKPLFRPFAG